MNNEDYSVSTTYREMAEEVIKEYEELQWLITSSVRIDYVSSTKDKKTKGKLVLGECKLVKDVYKLYIPYDFLIIIYEPNIEGLTQEQIKILLYHELLHIDVTDTEGDPQYNVAPHDIEDFRAVIDKYGLDWAENGC